MSLLIILNQRFREELQDECDKPSDIINDNGDEGIMVVDDEN